ncbi:DNA cytosine methyltransferase [Legionella pneumophila]|nr:DNA cytosine methyltransferase [Legionella pneumophila]MDI9844129.1 DNA cytosine methyltransferase [Legionella pneumophila]
MNCKFNKKNTASSKQTITAVDLFCGAGGLTHGLEKSGINVKLGIDIDPACKYPYVSNNQADFLLKSVDDVEASELFKVYGNKSLKLLAGCAPCQTFSTYNQKAGPNDKRWWLLLQFLRLIKETEPELVTMENVPGLITQDVFKKFVRDLESWNYYVDYKVVNCTDYGLPQKRKRLVLLASKLGFIKLIGSNKIKRGKLATVRDAIGNLSKIEAGMVDPNDPLHQSSSLTEINYKRMLVSKPGGTWRDWPEELVVDCHKKKTGKTYPGVYGRMSWDEPAPTITTQFFGFGNGRFGHPEQNRAISLREGALLQSFPKKYKFTAPGEPISRTSLGRLIGNAVPVRLGEVIGKSILQHVKKYNASILDV